MIRRGWLATCCLAAMAFPAGVDRSPSAATQANRPRLVVLLVMDQFRADYADVYRGQWTGGLARLFSDGAVFTEAAYPYAGTVTCPGHFTIGTGTLPSVHGMIGNAWYDAAQRRSTACVTDPTVTSVPFGGGAGRETHSAKSARALAFADELLARAPRPAQVVALALKPRSAIGLGGRGGPTSVVLWEEDRGTWATSTAYTATPWPDVEEFVAARPITAEYGKTWDRLLPEARYLHLDDEPGERAPGNWTTRFPHRLDSVSGKPDNSFVSNWERSPFSSTFLIDFALHLLQRRKLGAGDGTDMLAISLPSLDLIGHEFGPRSHEVQDVLARADADIGRLLDALDRQVGRGRYVLAFSSDHGVAPVPEQAQAEGLAGGRIASADLRAAVNRAIGAILGEGTYAGAASDQNIWLTAGTYERLRSTNGAVEAVRAALLAVPGIAHVHTVDELASTAPTDDPVLRSWRMSYVPDRSGQFVVTPRKYWIVRSSGGTTHGTPHDYDARVPVVFFGAGIRAGKHTGQASPVDIVPTLAALTGITLTQTSGRVLKDAIAR